MHMADLQLSPEFICNFLQFEIDNGVEVTELDDRLDR